MVCRVIFMSNPTVVLCCVGVGVFDTDSNDSPACDDDAHKAVLCTQSYFL